MLVFRTMAALKQFMKTGVPEVDLPPLDPMKLDNVEFHLAGAVVTFKNVTAQGLSNHQTKNVRYDKATRYALSTFMCPSIFPIFRTIEMTMAIPKLSTNGHYSLQGKVLNVDGLDSNGPYRFKN
jgi:hypothetical protein